MPGRPSLDEFRRVYYDRELDYWDIADTWGMPRWQVDDWRRAFGLPSRRHYGTYRRNHPEDDWQYPFISRHAHYAKIQPHLWDRRRLPPLGASCSGAFDEPRPAACVNLARAILQQEYVYSPPLPACSTDQSR